MDDIDLHRVPLFEGLTEDELARIEGWLEPIDVPSGWYLVNEGSSPVGFFILIEGQAQVDRAGAELATLHPGDFFGEMALLVDEPRSATVVTTTRVHALVMDGPEFFEMCAEIPEVGERIREAATARGRG